MTDMTLDIQQIQTAQTVSKVSTAAKANTSADGESFSEKLDRAVSEANEGLNAQQQNEESEKLGSEMASEMLIDIPLMPVIPVIENDGQTIAPAEGQVKLDGVIPEQNMTAELLPEIEPPVAEQAPAPAENIMQEAPATEIQQPTTTDTVTVESTVAAKDAPVEQETEQPIDSFQAQTQFSRSIQQAQHLIRNTDSATSLRSQPIKIDVDELQKQVDAGEFLTQQQAAVRQIGTEQVQPQQQNSEAIEPREVFPQIRQGAQQHIEQGDSDFTIKLRPEGLGEITVKLASQDGRVTLSLSASNANVQKLLGSEIDNLREIMRPYNVEVAQVEQSNSAVFADLQQQLQQHGSPQQNFSRQPNSFFAGETVEAAEQEQPEEEPQLDAVLDRYI